MARQTEVCEGQRYAELIGLRRSPRLWRVERVFDDAAANTHARLVDVSYRHDTKTISCAALTDRRCFTPVTAETAEPSP